MKSKYIIYGLCSSADNVIKYVGLTKQKLSTRLKAHIYDATHPLNSSSYGSYKSRWIRKVLRSGHNVNIIILEETIEKECDEKERLWITRYGKNNLTNVTIGGRDLFPSIINKKDAISIPEVKRFLERNINGWFKNVSLTRYALSNYEEINEPLDKYFIKFLNNLGFDYKTKDVVNLKELKEKIVKKSLENLKVFITENEECFRFEYQIGAFKEIYGVPTSKRIFKKELEKIIEESFRR